MIDKKPFRVTNEELKILEDMSDAEIGEKMGLVKFIRKLATDLLEARETIEKQEEIIKEMRGIIRRYVKLDTKCEVQDNLNSNATSILEKTKEYA